MKTFLLLLVFFLSTFLTTHASESRKYWIYLKDKPQFTTPIVSEETAINRNRLRLPLLQETDFPIDTSYINRLKELQIATINHSKWLNAVTAFLTPNQIHLLQRQTFVKEIAPVDANLVITRTPKAPSTIELAPVLQQIQAEAFSKEGLTGKGVTIGVIDAGFYGSDSSESLKRFFINKHILGVKDYVKPYQNPELLFSVAESHSDVHGTEVLAAIAGLNPKENMLYGVATNSKFYLARTDYALREWRGEEDNWIAALEWMDSLGVRLINSSLGYAKGFNNPSENYSPSQMDGKSTAITRAAQIATEKKGMLIIVSAGNEGEDKSWRTITAPADAKGVLSVGATNQKYWTRIEYSSIGPEKLGYLKPNVACHSLYGTSLSAPVITGFAACLMQLAPHLTSQEIYTVIEKSAHLYPHGNNFVGYGVPNATRAIALVKSPYLPISAQTINAKGKSIEVPLQTEATHVALYRKKDKHNVINQQVVPVTDQKIIIKRINNEKFTTVDLKHTAIEVIWE